MIVFNLLMIVSFHQFLVYTRNKLLKMQSTMSGLQPIEYRRNAELASYAHLPFTLPFVQPRTGETPTYLKRLTTENQEPKSTLPERNQ